MITVYGMPSCPDCAAVEEQVKGREEKTFTWWTSVRM